MNKERTRFINTKQGKIVVISVLCLWALFVIGMIVVDINIYNTPQTLPANNSSTSFVAPDFDITMIEGKASNSASPESDLYMSYYMSEKSKDFKLADNYEISVCGNFVSNYKDSLTIYLSCKETNDVYVKLQVLDETNTIIGETGLVKPGCTVKTVNLNKLLLSGENKLTYKIISYELDTYYSKGIAKLGTVITCE